MQKKEIIFLLLALLLVIFLHSRYIRETYYDHDVAGYVYNSLDLLNGHGWYASTWHNKPPGINIIFSLAFLALGRSFISIYIAALMADVVSVFLLYLFARYLLREEARFYFLLPLFYALLCVSEAVAGHSANTEKFLAVFEIAGIFCLGLAYKKKRNIFYLIAGFLLGIGLLIKQAGLVTFISGILFILAAKIMDKEPLRLFIKKSMIFTFAFVIPICLIAGYFLKIGALNDFIKCTFVNNIQYFRDIPRMRAQELWRSLHEIWSELNVEIIIFGLFSLAGIIYSCLKRSALRFLVLSWFIICVLALGKFAIFRHYFIQLIAPVACLGILGVSDIYKKVLNRGIPRVLFFILLFIPFLHVLGPLIMRRQPIASAYGAKERFLVSQYVKQRANPFDKLFVWDDIDSGAIYLWSGLASVSSFRSKFTLLPEESVAFSQRSLAGDYKLNQGRLLSDLAKEPPAYIIVVEDVKYELSTEAKNFPEFLDILQNKYWLQTQIGQDPRILIYRRN